jgi:hypothetical protein
VFEPLEVDVGEEPAGRVPGGLVVGGGPPMSGPGTGPASKLRPSRWSCDWSHNLEVEDVAVEAEILQESVELFGPRSVLSLILPVCIVLVLESVIEFPDPIAQIVALPSGFGECRVWGAAALLVAGTTRGGLAGAHAIASGLEAKDIVLCNGELALGVSHLAPVLGALSGGRVCESLVAV